MIWFSLPVILFLACQPNKPEIAQWRGISRDGIYPGERLPDQWPESGPELSWSFDSLGNGYGSPVVWNHQIFVNGEIDSVSQVFAFDQKGKLLWKTANGREFVGEGFSGGFPGSRSTPTVYDKQVYALSGVGQLACLDALTGQLIWSRHLVDDFGGVLGYFGFSESLLVDEQFVYAYPGGASSSVVCLNRMTGEVIWTSKATAQPAAFCSPIEIALPDRKLIVTISSNKLFALDASNGELLWSLKEDSIKMDDEYCNTPVFSDGYLYSVPGAEAGKGAMKLKLSSDGRSIEEIWRCPDVRNLLNGFVVVDGKLFATSTKKKLWSVDCESGLILDTLKNISGSIIAADHKLICYGENGNVYLIDPTGARMKVSGKFTVARGTKEHLAYPVLSNGILYIRHGKSLLAYKVR